MLKNHKNIENEIKSSKNDLEEYFFEIDVSRFFLESIEHKLDFLEAIQKRVNFLNDVELDTDSCCHFVLMDIQEGIGICEEIINSIQELSRNLIFQTENIRIDNQAISEDTLDLSECDVCLVR